MPPAEIIALTDEIHARLEHGEFAGLGPIAVGGGQFLPDAQVVARILLAEVGHREEQREEVNAAQWVQLAEEMRAFLHEVEHHLALLRDVQAHLAAHIGRFESRLDEAATPSIIQRFELALQRSPIVVYSQDTDLHYTWIYNPHPDFEPERIIGMTDAAFYQSDELERLQGLKRRVMATGLGARETVLATLHGTPTYYDLTVEPLYDAHGVIIGVTGAATDITALMHTEQALARREAQLNEAQRIARLGSWEWDVVADQLTWSAEQYRIWGFLPDAGVPSLQSALARIHPDDRERVKNLIHRSLETGEPYAAEFRILHPHGEERVIHGRGAAVRDAVGRVERLIGTSQDITERVQTDAMRAADRERQARLDGMIFAARQLADSASHRLERSCGGMDAFLTDSATGAEMRAALDAAMQDLRELRRLVGDAPSSDAAGFQGEASGLTPEA
jgi:PAS domain-containing protein